MKIIQFTDDTIGEKVKRIKENKENGYKSVNSTVEEDIKEISKLLQKNTYQNTSTFDFKTNITHETEDTMSSSVKNSFDYSPSRTFGSGPGILYVLFSIFVLSAFIGYFLVEIFKISPLLSYIIK